MTLVDQCVKRACFFEHRKAKNDRTNAGAKLVDVSPVISAVDEESQAGINALLNPKSQLSLSEFQQELARIKQQLTTGNGETLFDAQRLHRVQSEIGDQAYQLSKSPNPKDRVPGGQLRISMKNSLIR
jgi:hypothetical protein